MRVFVAGATGSVGFEVVRLAKARGCYVRTLSQSPKNAARLAGLADQVKLQDACTGVPSLDGIDVAVSALGASVAMGNRERRGYGEVDLPANAKLLEAAQTAGVRRFVYVSAHLGAGYRDTAYIRAHESFVELLRQSGIGYSVIRPTGIFPALRDFVGMARIGLATTVGSGMARTNPVHQTDVAELLVENLVTGPTEISIGGPDVLTRREIAELAFRAMGKRPRVLPVPAAAFRAAAFAAKLLNPRRGELLQFAAAVSSTDCVAPAIGRLRLEDYFRSIAIPGVTTPP